MTCAVSAVQVSEARRAELEADLPRAEKAYEIALKTRPTADLWQRLGLVRHLQNKYQQAIPAFEQALRGNPRLWPSHLFLGICKYRTNQFDPALRSLQQADWLAPVDDPGRIEIEYWLGATHIALKHPLAGLQRIERLLAREPAHLQALELAAKTYAELGSSLWNAVAEQHFDSAPGLEVHGHALESEGKLESALEAFQNAKALAPRRRDTDLAIAQLHLRQGKAPATVEILREQLTNKPADPEAAYLAGLAQTQTGDYIEAAANLETASRWRTRFPESALALTQVYLALRQPENATRAANMAVESAPRSPAAHELLIAALRQAGSPDRIEQENQRWLKVAPK